MMKVFERSVRLAKLVFRPGGLKALLTWKPFSMTIFEMMQALEGLHFRTVLDCGANIGQFARGAAQTFPEAKIICFEPLPDAVEKLRHHLADCPRVNVVQSAVGSSDGTLTFRPNAYSQASSPLPAHANLSVSFPVTKELDPIEVQVARLDTLLANEDLQPPVLA